MFCDGMRFGHHSIPFPSSCHIVGLSCNTPPSSFTYFQLNLTVPPPFLPKIKSVNARCKSSHLTHSQSPKPNQNPRHPCIQIKYQMEINSLFIPIKCRERAEKEKTSNKKKQKQHRTKRTCWQAKCSILDIVSVQPRVFRSTLSTTTTTTILISS